MNHPKETSFALTATRLAAPTYLTAAGRMVAWATVAWVTVAWITAGTLLLCGCRSEPGAQTPAATAAGAGAASQQLLPETAARGADEALSAGVVPGSALAPGTPVPLSAHSSPLTLTRVEHPTSSVDRGGASAAKEGAAANLVAPVELQLTQAGSRSDLALTLEFQVTQDLQRVVARFVLPEGVQLLSGSLEQDFAGMQSGQSRTLAVHVKVPQSGDFVVAAGVDAYRAAGVRLHKSAVLQVGKE